MTPDDPLQVLLDRACRALTPAEAAALRAGVRELQQHASVDTTVWCLREELEQTEAMYLTANRRADRYRAAWKSARARAHHARCVLADYRTEADARTARQEECDHRDPNRLGHRPSDLAIVCSCGHVLFPPIFGPTGHFAQQPSDDEVRANVQAVMEQYIAGKYREEVAAQEAAIEAYLADSGFTVTRTSPVEQLAAEHDTLQHLGAALTRIAGRDAAPLGQIGQLTGVPMVVDDTLPAGEVHLRPHPKRTEEAQ